MFTTYARALAVGGGLGLIVVLLVPGVLGGGLSLDGRITLAVFIGAVLAWTVTRVDDTFVALAAATLLVVTGAVDPAALFASLGGEVIWLLVTAFILAAGLTATGLPDLFAARVLSAARSVRHLAHLCTMVLTLSALAIPATSGRAALALPVFLSLATAFADRPALVRALALLFPTVILLTAAATLTGAGAHLITNQVLAAAGEQTVGFGHWLLLGVPFALVAGHLATEVVLFLMTKKEDRRTPVSLPPVERGPLTGPQKRALAVLVTVVVLWAAEPLHGVPAALIALIGALLVTAPRIGTTKIGAAINAIPWSLLVFMAATTLLGAALYGTGAAGWLAAMMPRDGLSPVLLLGVVIVVSTAAHLVVQSRSARSSVLIPVLVPVALAAGLNPTAVAFASTVAAGFCHTLPSSAKPVAIFAGVEDAPTYDRSDLARLALVLGPLSALLVLLFALFVWPLFGLSLSPSLQGGTR